LYLFAGASSSVNRARVSHHLWARGILVAPCIASRAVAQTRPLPLYRSIANRLAASAPLTSRLRRCSAPSAGPIARPTMEVISRCSSFHPSSDRDGGVRSAAANPDGWRESCLPRSPRIVASDSVGTARQDLTAATDRYHHRPCGTLGETGEGTMPMRPNTSPTAPSGANHASFSES
jgi:hypothetical protein